jgi:hypothetical protein
MPNNDWREVYLQERQRPGYVLENGRSPIKCSKEAASRQEVKPSIQEK